MKIYVCHSRSFDYQKELYTPLRKSSLNDQHEIVLPHEMGDEPFDSKEFFKTCDLVIAEVSFPATGVGIELGWANILNIPIICIYQEGSDLSGSLKVISNTFLAYRDSSEMIEKLKVEIQKLK